MTEDINTQPPKLTKEDVRELLIQFEAMVRALNLNFNEDEIFKLVAMILNNHFQNGQPTEEYIQMSKEALKMRAQMGEQLNPAQRIIVSDFQPRQKRL